MALALRTNKILLTSDDEAKSSAGAAVSQIYIDWLDDSSAKKGLISAEVEANKRFSLTRYIRVKVTPFPHEWARNRVGAAAAATAE